MANKYGKWSVIKTLSEGGQGQIFLVRREDDPEEEEYVLKRFKNPSRLHRHEDEVSAAIRLDHPNIIEYIDDDLHGDKPYMVVEYCAGGSLSNADFGDWSTIARLRLFSTICNSVGHAHSQGIIHRDLKPDNVFLREDGKTPVVGDFGICFIEDGERFTLTGEAVGPRMYIAPELEDGRLQDVTARSDVYSLGKILYWLFRRQVFAREKHREPKWDLTSKQRDLKDTERYELSFVNELLDKTIAPDPADRLSNANQLGAHVDRAIWRIQGHAHVLDLREVQICDFCGIGHYQAVGDTTKGDEQYGVDDAKRFGASRVDGAHWLVLWCNHCGHVQHFRTDTLHPNPWIKGDTD